MPPIIDVRGLSKKYDISHQRAGYQTLRDSLSSVGRSPLSFLKKKALDFKGGNQKETYWALRDVNMSVEKGEIVGVIGANGAGKSTLLKILSRITPPTAGEARLRGRVGSLLEVGTGFHPELTGRENVFLNGSILGMSRQEILRKFDEIVDFAGIEKFLDTPVKRYSSGMYVRLAFSVAAHLEPDILIIDEVLSVGDAQFQKKCLGKMKSVTEQDGRTILFVSHDMRAVQQLCERCILLEKGTITLTGDPTTVIDTYLQSASKSPAIALVDRKDRRGDGRIRFTQIELLSEEADGVIRTGKPFTIRLHFRTAAKDLPLFNTAVSLTINDLQNGQHLLAFWTETAGASFTINQAEGTIDCKIETCPLVGGAYSINIYSTVNEAVSDYVIHAQTLNIDDTAYYGNGRRDHSSHPQYVINHEWNLH